MPPPPKIPRGLSHPDQRGDRPGASYPGYTSEPLPSADGLSFEVGIEFFPPIPLVVLDFRRSQGVRSRSPPAAGAHPLSRMPGIIPLSLTFFSVLYEVHRPILSGGGLREGEHPPPVREPGHIPSENPDISRQRTPDNPPSIEPRTIPPPAIRSSPRFPDTLACTAEKSR